MEKEIKSCREQLIDLNELILNEDQRISLADSGRQRVIDQFSIQRMVQELESVYKSYAP